MLEPEEAQKRATSVERRGGDGEQDDRVIRLFGEGDDAKLSLRPPHTRLIAPASLSSLHILAEDTGRCPSVSSSSNLGSSQPCLGPRP